MQDLLYLLIIFAVWIVVAKVVLPKIGIHG